MESNVLWNWVRETGDHGPFNSWDRQPYLTDIRTPGQPSLVPAQNNITRNMLFNSYSSAWPLDHDDGSAYYTDSKNFMLYGGYKAYLGHSKTVVDNVYVHPEWRAGTTGATADVGTCVLNVGLCPQSCAGLKMPGHPSMWDEEWSNNTCIFGGSAAHPSTSKIGDFGTAPTKQIAHNNKYLVPAGTDVWLDFYATPGRMTLAQAQATGVDTGSTVGATPTDEAIVAMGRALLL